MNLVFDGLSGVGKSYLAQELAKKLNIDFVDFLVDKPNYDPNDPDMEIILYQELIRTQRRTPIITENSIYQAYLVKWFMYTQGEIDYKTLSKLHTIKTRAEVELGKYIIIKVYDTEEQIETRRKIRGRKWEYNPEWKPETIKSLDSKLRGILYSTESSSLILIHHHRQKYNSVEEEIQALDHQITQALIK